MTTPADLIWGALSDLGERLREALATEAEAEGRHSEAPDDAERCARWLRARRETYACAQVYLAFIAIQRGNDAHQKGTTACEECVRLAQEYARKVKACASAMHEFYSAARGPSTPDFFQAMAAFGTARADSQRARLALTHHQEHHSFVPGPDTKRTLSRP